MMFIHLFHINVFVTHRFRQNSRCRDFRNLDKNSDVEIKQYTNLLIIFVSVFQKNTVLVYCKLML